MRNWIAWASFDLNEPALTTTSNWFIGTLALFDLVIVTLAAIPTSTASTRRHRLDAAWGVDVRARGGCLPPALRVPGPA